MIKSALLPVAALAVLAAPATAAVTFVKSTIQAKAFAVTPGNTTHQPLTDFAVATTLPAAPQDVAATQTKSDQYGSASATSNARMTFADAATGTFTYGTRTIAGTLTADNADGTAAVSGTALGQLVYVFSVDRAFRVKFSYDVPASRVTPPNYTVRLEQDLPFQPLMTYVSQTGGFNGAGTLSSGPLAAGEYQLSFTNQVGFSQQDIGTGARVVAPANFSFAIGQVPEPASWALLIGGFGMIGGTLRRRRLVPA